MTNSRLSALADALENIANGVKPSAANFCREAATILRSLSVAEPVAEVVGFHPVGFQRLPIVSWTKAPEIGLKLYTLPKEAE